ncbi:MAG: hypothetical protein ACK4NF_07405 [Planctomycetota bacterium]
MYSTPVIIIEGLFALYDPKIRKLAKCYDIEIIE